MNTYKLQFTRLQGEILRFLFIKSGKSFNQRRIARSLNVSQPAVQKALPYLEKENLIEIQQDRESKRWSIRLNRDKHQIMQLKRVDNLKQIYESGLADFLENEFPGATIILFGSYSRGDDTYDSDIDLAIIGRKEKTINSEEYEKRLEREIRINFYPSLKEVHKDLRENICNGIVLVGGIEL